MDRDSFIGIGIICFIIAGLCTSAGEAIGGFLLGAAMFIASVGSMIYLGISIVRVKENSTRRRREMQARCFLACLAAMLAKMAKADGTVSKDEIETVEVFFRVMKLNPLDQRYCREVFRTAKDDENSVYDYAYTYFLHSNRQQERELIYEMLWDVAVADGRLDPAEDEILRKLPEHLKIPASLYDSNKVKRMSRNRSSDRNRTDEQQGSFAYSGNLEDDFALACKVLGVSPTVTNEELRDARRKMVMKWHPDHMEGLPDYALKKANAKMSEINNAWEIIMRKRGIK